MSGIDSKTRLIISIRVENEYPSTGNMEFRQEKYLKAGSFEEVARIFSAFDKLFQDLTK